MKYTWRLLACVVGLTGFACGGSSGDGTGGAGGGSGSTLHSVSHGNTGGGVTACNPGDTHECYTGPSGTLDVGLCKAGLQLCDETGKYGPCMNQVQPKEENCKKRGDEDCNGNACSDAMWDVVAGDAQSQLVTAVAVDPDGNIYAAGGFQGTIDLGNGPVSATGAGDLFLAKFDTTGKLLWEKDFSVGGGTFNAAITSISISSNNEVVIGGSSAGAPITFGTTMIAAPAHHIGFVGLFDGDGMEQWVKTVSGSGDVSMAGVAFEVVSSTIIVGGGFAGALSCGTGPCPSTGGTSSSYLRAYGPNGGDQWTKSYGTANDGRITSLAATSDGRIFAAGVYSGSTKLAGNTLPSVGADDVFVLGVNNQGNASVGISLGSTGSDTAVIAVRGDGSFVVGGHGGGEIIVGGVTTGPGSKGAYLFAFDDHGQPQWASSFGSDGKSTVESLDMDGQGYVLVAGTVSQGKANFGDGVINNTQAAPDAALAKINGNGDVYWSKKFIGPGAQGSLHVAANGDGIIAFSVGYQNTIDFGLGVRTSNNTDGQTSHDIALVSFQP